MKQQKYIRYILLPTTLLCLIASLFCGCSANSGKISKTGFYFDTMITVTLYGTRDEKILDDCFSLAGNYEKKLSNTITDSEVSKINEANLRNQLNNIDMMNADGSVENLGEKYGSKTRTS